MEPTTPVKECQDRDRAGNCEDGAMSGDCGGTSASDLSTSYNSSPGAEAEADDPNCSGNLSAATSATSDPPLQPLQLPADRREESAVQVIRNIFSIMKQNNGEFGLPKKALSEATGLGMLPLNSAPQEVQAQVVKAADEPEIEKRADTAQEAEDLRRELIATRCELESAMQDAKAAEQLREDQAVLIEKLATLEQREAKCVESAAELEEKARRHQEMVSLERHIFEVEIRRVQCELQLAAERTEVLDKDLKQAQKQAIKQQRRGQKAGHQANQVQRAKDVLSRHELALRASFQEEQSSTASKQKRGSRSKPEDQGWFSFGCCSSVDVAPKQRA